MATSAVFKVPATGPGTDMRLGLHYVRVADCQLTRRIGTHGRWTALSTSLWKISQIVSSFSSASVSTFAMTKKTRRRLGSLSGSNREIKKQHHWRRALILGGRNCRLARLPLRPRERFRSILVLSKQYNACSTEWFVSSILIK